MARRDLRHRIAKLHEHAAERLVPAGEEAERRMLRVLLRAPDLRKPPEHASDGDDWARRLTDEELRMELRLLVLRAEAELGLGPIEQDRRFAAVPLANLYERAGWPRGAAL